MTGTVTFTATETDHFEAVRSNFIQQVQSHRFRNRMALWTVGAASMVVLVAAVAGGNIVEALTIGVLSAVGGAAGLAVCISGNFLLLRRRSGRIFRQHKALHRQVEFSWDDVGSRWRSDQADVTRAWSDYHRWTEGRRTLLMYLNDYLFEFVPLTALSSAELDDLRSSLRAVGVPLR
jgi:hypothetical protein